MLTPLEIENKKFRRELRGYCVEEVEEFIRAVSQNYEHYYKEYLAAKDRIEMLTEAIKQYKSMEETMQNALVVAQSVGEEVKKNAYAKADNIIREAEHKANQLIADAGHEVTRISYEYEEMKRSVEVFRAKIVSLLNSQLDIVKNFSEIESEVEEKLEHTEQTIADAANAPEPTKEERADIPAILEDLERITRELPKIELNENGEYVAVEEEKTKVVPTAKPIVEPAAEPLPSEGSRIPGALGDGEEPFQL